MRMLALAVTLLLLSTTSLDAQRNCVKGKPCGNSCIAQNRTCRIAPTPTTTKAPATTQRQPVATAPTKNAAQLRADSIASADRTRAALATTRRDSAPAREPDLDLTLSPFVGDASRKVFFKRGCAAASRVKEDDLVVFMTTTGATTAGYARSGAPGC